MTTQIRSLMFVAAVAILPVACGTTSPMGTDLAALEAGAQVSAFRSDVPVPPQAPEPQSPESDTAPVPAPADPGQIPEDPRDPQADPGSIELPTSRTAPAPSDPNTDPNDPDTDPTDPNTDPLPSPAPPDGNTVPVPPTSDPQDTVPPTGDTQGIPVPPSSDTVPVCVQDGNPNLGCPAPSPVPPTDPVECQVASIEIMSMRQTILEPAGEGFRAILTDKGGLLIDDGSCEKLVWAVEGARDQSRVVIRYDNDSRYVYIEGMHGTYKVGVTAPNGVSASIGFEVI